VQPTRAAARRSARHSRKRDACRSYLVLLPVGFSLPPPLPAARCALTAPFHPCRPPGVPGRTGGVLSVALSLGSPPPGVTRHRTSVEPGLSSLPRRGERPSGRLAQEIWEFATCLSKPEGIRPHGILWAAPLQPRVRIGIVLRDCASIIAANHPRTVEKRELHGGNTRNRGLSL